MIAAILPLALAGYGDPVDGYPSWSERELHLYTNAARVDPEAHEDSYQAGGCSYYRDFSDDEQTPKLPVYWHLDLNEAARYHSDDMRANDWFSHDSSDGTSFQQRLARFYSKSSSIGENIAYGYPDPWAVNMEGWMCSHEGHRENIMSDLWYELGTGVSSQYYTQDFAAGIPETGLSIRMGVHTPQAPSGEAIFYADYAGEGLGGFFLVLDGEPVEMEVLWGEEESGVFVAEVDLGFEEGEEACSEYYFWYEDGGGEGTFPEEGSYLVGSGCEEDWVDGQVEPGFAGGFAGGDPLADVRLVGCSASGVGSALWLLPLLATRKSRDGSRRVR